MKIYIIYMKKKKIKEIKLQLPGATANPAPPVGPALGAAGLNIIQFCKDFNEKTKHLKDTIIPIVNRVISRPKICIATP